MVAVMADQWLAQGSEAAATALATRLQPRQLAALGTVLCLYRPQHGSELSGWSQAVRVEARIGLESDGLRESLLFFDREGRSCWQLWLLPESDFLAWDRLAACLPGRGACASEEGVGERLWQRLARCLSGETWRGCALRLHALPQPSAGPVLAASLAPMSSLGLVIARDIARAEGAEIRPLAGDWDCPPSLPARMQGGGAAVQDSSTLVDSRSSINERVQA